MDNLSSLLKENISHPELIASLIDVASILIDKEDDNK